MRVWIDDKEIECKHKICIAIPHEQLDADDIDIYEESLLEYHVCAFMKRIKPAFMALQIFENRTSQPI